MLDGIPNVVPNYMKDHKPKNCGLDLDYMLYRHVKEMVSNNTTYFLCAENSIIRENKKYLSTYTEITICVMVIQKNIQVKTKVNCIIYCMHILLKRHHKWYRTDLMGKIFASDLELDNMRVHTVTRLIHEHTPSDDDEPGSKLTDKEFCAQIW